MVEIHVPEDTSGFEAAMRFLDEYSSADEVASPPSSVSPPSSSSDDHDDDHDDFLGLALLPRSPISRPVSPMTFLPVGFNLGQVKNVLESPLPVTEAFNPFQVVKATSTSTSGSSGSSSSSDESSKRPKHKTKRPANYNSNKAREERRQELQYLRKKAAQLEEELETLQHKQRYTGSSLSPSSSFLMNGNELDLPRASANVWQEIAARQLEERRRSEQENIQLKVVLENQIKVAKSLERLLHKRTTLAGMEACGLGKRKRVYPTPANENAAAVFKKLLHRVERCYLEIDGLFARMGISHMEHSYRNAQVRDGEQGMFLEIHECKILPVNVHSAGAAVWQHFAQNMEHIPFRQYYERAREDVTEDTIIENIGMELHANGTKADFRVQQVLRRYVEEDRVIIVWSAIINPVAFSDKPLSGVFFREQGYMLLKMPKTLDADEFSVLNTAHIITPEFTNGSLNKDDEVVGQLSDFVLAGTAASTAASHQMIENVLMRELLNRQRSAI
ncbi:hypothetical protein Poli38472_000514 [Pythium oligandrum]|uniref:M96 mating-specific protein family n=1 Tax=Pythium oligandrum TaxID=41045 RepID=A0A8K1CC26_PYTOL|nr:hypothetical protein Poli38472_000514 [Pythium oligandrum]|eukprot:TMW60472.1 hypothetical protein Poli38472_000514 [Pythium oligandrum]